MSFAEDFQTGTAGADVASYVHKNFGLGNFGSAGSSWPILTMLDFPGTPTGLVLTGSKAVRSDRAAPTSARTNVWLPPIARTLTFQVACPAAGPPGASLGVSSRDDGRNYYLYRLRDAGADGVVFEVIRATAAGSGPLGPPVPVPGLVGGGTATIAVVETPGPDWTLAIAATVSRGSSTATFGGTDPAPLLTADGVVGIRGEGAATESAGFRILSIADDGSAPPPLDIAEAHNPSIATGSAIADPGAVVELQGRVRGLGDVTASCDWSMGPPPWDRCGTLVGHTWTAPGAAPRAQTGTILASLKSDPTQRAYKLLAVRWAS